MRLLECQIKTVCPTEEELAVYAAAKDDDTPAPKFLSEMSDRDQHSWIEGMFIFGCTWSLGASVDSAGRVVFDKLIRELMDSPITDADVKDKYGIIFNVDPPEKSLTVPIPRNGDVYSFRWVMEDSSGKWQKWSDAMKNSPELTKDMNINQIIVPTQVSKINTETHLREGEGIGW